MDPLQEEEEEVNGVKMEEEHEEEDCQLSPQGVTVEDQPSAPTPRRARPRHRCSLCGRDFSRPSRLADHLASHSGFKPHSCSVCGKRFTKKINVFIHQRVHTGEKPYSCSDCGASYAQPGCLRRHRVLHAAEKPHRCSACGHGFIQRRHLVQHERTHTGEKPFCCPLCPKRFASRNGLVDHRKTHAQQKYSCSVCQKAFSSPSSFRDHTRLHTGQKLHPCSLCGKGFNRPGLLRKHLQKHVEQRLQADGEDEALLHCFPCQRDFPSLEELEEHKQLVHAPQLACDVCGRRFSRASRLSDHMRTHTGERPFQCSVCRKRFSAQRGLRKHQEIHKKTASSVAKATGEAFLHISPSDVSSGTDSSAGCVLQKPEEPLCRAEEEEEAVRSLTGKVGAASERSSAPYRPHHCSICPRSFLKPCLLRKHMRIHIRDGLIPDPADKEFWLHMRTDGEGKEEEDTQDDPPADPPAGPGPLPGNPGDQGTAPSGGVDGEDGDVSGLINSDGEEEQWRPAPGDPDAPSQPADGRSKHCCPVCGRDCFKASALQKHLRIHSGERPFQCATCRKSFVQHVHLTEHQRTHTGEKPYTCSDCGKSFAFSSALRRHQRLHTDARPFVCPVCQKSFKQRCVLKNHQLTHSGVRYQCPLCSKSFSRALELTYHVDAHSDARPYFCSICCKNLSGARIYRNHMRRHEAQNTPQTGPAETRTT